MPAELTQFDFSPIWLSLKLASITTVLLLLLATPVAWWLDRSEHRLKSMIAALVTLPLVLPPSVLGFYLLLMLGPNGPIGSFSQQIGLGSLAFSFKGLVIASVIYSFPFAVQPIQNAFEAMGKKPLEAAATLGASPFDRFFTISLPMIRPGLVTAAVLGFAHTIGEFGVILMIGGNIPGETKVLSVAIYEHVESMEFQQAHILSGGMVLFSFIVLFTLYSINGKTRRLH
ncbi:MAG: molybdate ABC transporter permease subunit [Pseudomonadales bacterium]|nr:molybdate ABC transporter permease subunit [Pseudomonadales bacterium]